MSLLKPRFMENITMFNQIDLFSSLNEPAPVVPETVQRSPVSRPVQRASASAGIAKTARVVKTRVERTPVAPVVESQSASAPRGTPAVTRRTVEFIALPAGEPVVPEPPFSIMLDHLAAVKKGRS